ncbi:hypothetical protein CGK17_07970 [Vibrio parahaemolyticus]|nr:hypothetical protein CGK17_07970 [Vibrio parahaemolyticus]TOF99040.1 hypothetical protein CGJ10_16505 [Vibrio parahaemolyticus]
MDGAGWHTEEIANDFKCQCNQTSPLFSRAKPYPDKYGVGCGNAIYPTNLLWITTTSFPSLRCMESALLLPKSHQNVLEKMDRPDQLVFQIGITSLGRENDSP